MAIDTRQLVRHILERAAPEQLADEVIALVLLSAGEACPEIGDMIAGHLSLRLDEAVCNRVLDRLSADASPLGRLVAARLHLEHHQPEKADDAMSAALLTASTPAPTVLAQRARLRANQGRLSEAIADLQSALASSAPYALFAKSEKLVERLIASAAWAPRRKARLALLASSTTAILAPVLRATAFARGVELEIYQGLYGNFRQEVLDPNSGLYRFQPDLAIVLVNHRDLHLGPLEDNHFAMRFAEGLRDLWALLRQRSACHIIQLGLDLPPHGAWGSLEDTLAEGRRRAIASANLTLSANLPTGISFLDPNALVAELGDRFWSDTQWYSAKQYPAPSALPRLADYLCAHSMAALGLSSKVLAVDLDNTLWGGVIGEDLLGGIRVGPPTPDGEAFVALQQYLKELQQRGVLLAVCSKNNRADAEAPFRQHEAMVLKLDDFAAFAANWNDKAGNLRTIAADLALGLDSFVFLDDNPMERAWVRSQLPQVIVPECGSKPWEMLAALERGLYFETICLTREDRQRHENYRANQARSALKHDAASLEDFLESLEMVAEDGPVDDHTLARVTQLVNKTNQFNLTTRRYTEEQVRAMALSPDWWCRWFRLADRFGDHGLIGAILAHRSSRRWTVDTWLMSCRVLGRNMEQFMAACLLQSAWQSGAAEVVGRYVPTEKNGLVQDLYPRMGFTPCHDLVGQYLFDLRQQPIPAVAFIRGRPAGSQSGGILKRTA